MNTPKIESVPLKDIFISKDNVRDNNPNEELDELAASIKELGLLQPVTLRGDSKDGPPFELIAGQRRFLAHERLGRTHIDAVFAGPLDKTEVIVRSLAENVQRVELDFADTAEAVTHLYKKFGKDEKRVQKRTGLSIRKIRDFILIDALASDKMKKLIKKQKISPTDVKRALKAAQFHMKKAERIVELIIERDLTPYQRKRLVDHGNNMKGATADEIVREAQKENVERNVVVSLSDEMRAALLAATTKLKMDADEVATRALEEWLRKQGFAE